MLHTQTQKEASLTVSEPAGERSPDVEFKAALPRPVLTYPRQRREAPTAQYLGTWTTSRRYGQTGAKAPPRNLDTHLLAPGPMYSSVPHAVPTPVPHRTVGPQTRQGRETAASPLQGKYLRIDLAYTWKGWTTWPPTYNRDYCTM